MQARIQKYLLITCLITALSSCGNQGDVRRIRALEGRMADVKDPAEKSELANRLHREYALYHLHDEEDTLFLRNWAQMAASGQEYEQAIDVYTMLINNDVTTAEIYASRGRLYAGLGYYGKAASDYQMAGMLLSGGASTRRREYDYLSGFYHQADSVIRKSGEMIAAGKDPLNHRLNRAEQYMRCGYYSAAVADIKLVQEVDSTYSRAFYLLGRTCLESGDFEQSDDAFLDYFNHATVEDPYYSEAATQQKRLSQLVQLQKVEQALKSEPYAYESLIEAAATAFRLEDFNKALVYATRLTEIFPDSIYGYLYRGQVGIQTGDLERAVQDMDRVIQLEPSNISARNLRAYVLLLRKDYTALRQEISEIRSRGGEMLDVLRPYASDSEQ